MTYEPHELWWMLPRESWPTEAAYCATTGEPVRGLKDGVPRWTSSKDSNPTSSRRAPQAEPVQERIAYCDSLPGMPPTQPAHSE